MPDFGTLAFSVGMILAGAGGSQILRSPEEWPLNVAGYRSRVADLTGFTVVQASTQRLIELGYGWRSYSAVCVRERIVSCAFERTFTGFDRNGIRHRNAPLIVGVLVASTASLLWRPERYDPAEALGFVGSRVVATSAGAWAGRVVHDWIATRPVR